MFRYIIVLVLGLIVFTGGSATFAGPIGPEFPVNTDTQTGNKVIAAAGDGGFVVAWGSYDHLTDANNIYGQLFNASGAPVASRFLVTNDPYHADVPRIARLSDGGFVVAWESWNGSQYVVKARRYNANANSVRNEFKVATGGSRPVLARLRDGGFVICWGDHDHEGLGVSGKRYNAAGSVVEKLRANTTKKGAQWDPAVTGIGDGGFIVVWSSSSYDAEFSDIYGQRFSK